MDWTEKLQTIIDYIETHLQRTEEPVNIDEISRISGCSFSFFQKVFSYMNQISLAEYIRLRKLTLAGYDLKNTEMRVIDISYKYGYDSPTSFTKAFQQFHGISPRDARKKGAQLQVYPKMQVAEKLQYSWKLEQKNGFRLIGKSVRLSCENNAHDKKVLEFWSECQRNGVFSRLISMDQGNPKGLFGVFSYCDQPAEEIEYAIMVEFDGQTPEGFMELEIPDETWAIFNCKGPVPQAMQNGWKFLNEEWLVQFPFRHAQCAELEWYSSGNPYDEDYFSQIWIPIISEGE